MEASNNAQAVSQGAAHKFTIDINLVQQLVTGKPGSLHTVLATHGH
jgi:hypothetical protein